MLITENVLRKIIAEEYEKLTKEAYEDSWSNRAMKSIRMADQGYIAPSGQKLTPEQKSAADILHKMASLFNNIYHYPESKKFAEFLNDPQSADRNNKPSQTTSPEAAEYYKKELASLVPKIDQIRSALTGVDIRKATGFPKGHIGEIFAAIKSFNGEE